MIQTRGRKILADISSRKGRTILVCLAIFVGVTGTITLFSMGDILTRKLDEDIREDEIAMVNVLVALLNQRKALDNDEYLNQLRQIEGVTTLQGITQGTAHFKLHENDTDYEDVNVISYSSNFEDVPIEPPRLLSGIYPLEDQNQIAIEQRFAEKYGLDSGDPIYFRISNRSSLLRPSGTHVERWTVSGIVFHPYVFSPSNSIYALPDDNRRLTTTRGFSAFMLRFDTYNHAHGSARAITQFISGETPYSPIFTHRQDPALNPLTLGAKRLSETMSALALIALFVSGFLVLNIISTVITEQKRQIGLMKSLGASRFDIFVIYTGLALAYGLISVVPGVLVGVPAGYFVAAELATQVNTVINEFEISYRAILIGVTAGLAVPVLASIIPVLDGTRVTILEAMTDSGIKANFTDSAIAKFTRWLPLPINIQLALRNIAHKKIRFALTILTLATAVGAFMGILAVFNSIDREIANFFSSFDANIAITAPLEDNPELVMEILESYLEEEIGIDASISMGYSVPISIDGYEPIFEFDNIPEITAHVYDPSENYLKLEIIRGEAPNNDHQMPDVIISEMLAAALEKDVGDTIPVTLLDHPVALTITAIASYPGEQVWLSIETLAAKNGFLEYLPEPNEYVTTLSIDQPENMSNPQTVIALGLDFQRRDLLTFIDGSFFSEKTPGAIVTTSFAADGDYSVGDQIRLTANGNTITLPIAGIFTPPGQFGDTLQLPTEFIALPWETLAKLEGRSLEDIPLPRAYFVNPADELSAEQLDNIIAQLDDVLIEAGIPANIFNFVGLLESLTANLRTFQAVLSAVSLLIAIVGALGLFSTLSMSVFERQREIGVMRSVGASTSAIMFQFLTEGLSIGLLAWLLGLPIAYLLSTALLDVMGLLR